MNYPLSEAEEPIRKALERLVVKDDGLHPFVVVDKVGNPDVFVQFAGGVGRPLFFDVPLLGIVLEATAPDTGAARAVGALLELGIVEDERVLIHEEEDKAPPWKGEPFWKRLFGG